MDKNEQFLNALRQIAAERKVDLKDVLEVVKEAVLASFKSTTNLPRYVFDRLSVEIDNENSKFIVYLKKDVVKDVIDQNTQIDLRTAQKANPNIKVGGVALVDVTPKGDFGRIAAQNARQVLLQKLSSLEKNAILNQYKSKIGNIINVYVQKISKDGDVICEISKVKAIMPKDEKIPIEYYKLGTSIKVMLKDIVEDETNKFMIVSRSDPKFVEALFRMEVPELESGTVEIVSIAREAGYRTKIAVKSNSSGIDPVGAFIGQRGVRINAVSSELKFGEHEEKIDVIAWHPSEEVFIKNTIRSAKKVEIVSINDRKVVVYVPDNDIPMAIGKDAQNVRLSSLLTGWDIEIKPESEMKK
ncbi:MAG: transcription termination factor NusA [Candidatus Dojkabacteria bacterium]|nr:transcription termination factor NusA [Candidatus Dojkabacteria bacterium]